MVRFANSLSFSHETSSESFRETEEVSRTQTEIEESVKIAYFIKYNIQTC